MNRLLLNLAIMVTGSSLFCARPAGAQVLPPAERAARVEIIEGPALELARADLAIIRWTSNNPGGLDDHFAVAHYGTYPNHLHQMAKSHIRLNREQAKTIFRVRMEGLEPLTTYYYEVTSTDANGENDGVKSAIHKFTTSAR